MRHITPHTLSVFLVTLIVGWMIAMPAQADPGSIAAYAAVPENKVEKRFSMHTLQRLRAKLDDSDRLAALRALHMALSRISDGATFIWRKKSRHLAGVIKPTTAFRNVKGQVCRHLIYSLSLGKYVKSIEGVACRGADGRWQLTS